MIRTLIFVYLIAGAFAIVLEDGPCPNIDPETFNLYRMAGIWYEYKHSESVEVVGQKCATLLWGEPVNNISKITFSHISTSDNINSTTISKVRFDNNKIFMDMQLPILGSYKEHYHILETDYDNYAIIVGCIERECQHGFLAWIKTRYPTPSEQIDGIIENAFRKHNLKIPRLIKFNKKGCYKEEIQSYSSVSSHASSSSLSSTKNN